MIAQIRLFVAAIVVAAPVAAADPLPKGAKARLGTPRMREATAWNGAALTPDGKFLVGYTPAGLTKFDVTTGQSLGTIGERPFGSRIEFFGDGSRGLGVNYSSASVWEAKTGKS